MSTFKRNMTKENVSLNFRLKKIDETRKNILYEVKHNALMSKKRKKSRTLNYFEHFLVFVSTVSGCVSISAFASLVDVPISIASSAVGLKMCAITAGIKKYR